MIILLIAGTRCTSVKGSLGHLPPAATAQEQEERLTLTARLDFGLISTPVVNRHFQFKNVPDGSYLLDVGTRYFHYETAVVKVERGVVSASVMNPFTRKINQNQSHGLILNLLGRTLIHQPPSSLLDTAKGMVFSMPGIMIGMFILLSVCKGMIPDLEEAAQPAAPQGQSQQVRRKKD